MANTVTRIATYTFPQSLVTYVFNNIPQTYNHLLVTMSCRILSGDFYGNAIFRPNSNNTVGLYNIIRSSGNGQGSSYTDWRTTDNGFYLPEFSGDTATASAFSNARVLIQNYTLSRFKSGWQEGGSENNSNQIYTGPRAFVWRSNDAITSLYFEAFSQFATGSEITLYGIKTS